MDNAKIENNSARGLSSVGGMIGTKVLARSCH